MAWQFPPNNGGQEQGYHDAGVETFRGDTDASLAREALQNALDAKRPSSDEPVRVEFSRFFLNPSEIPGGKELMRALRASETVSGSDKEAAEFFQNAQKVLSKKVPVLKVSDFGTTGITGPPTERESNWYNLVRRTGASYKVGGKGGSFGIGKNAPFAASSLRTVFYSTCNTDSETLFQGVAKLVTHEDKDGELLQAVGFYSGVKGSPLGDGAIPPQFQRKELGADIFVMGYQGGDGWTKGLSQAVLEYFWPAILHGGLVVKVDDLIIEKANIDALMQADKEMRALPFYQAATDEASKPFAKELKHLGPVQLKLLPGPESFPNEVAMVRKTGMVIYFKAFRSPIRYAGFFLCENDLGNEQLRKMEPPMHNLWDGDRPEKGANTRVLTELYNWMRECVGTLRPMIESKTVSVPDLYKYLPDLQAMEQAELAFGATGGPPIKDETASVSPAATPVQRRPIRISPKSLPKAQKPEDVDDDNDDVVSDPSKRKLKKPGHEPGPDENRQEIVKTRCRVFLTDGSTGTYRVVAHPDETVASADLVFGAVGDDGTSTPLRITNAVSLPDCSVLQVKNGNRIAKVSLQAGQPARFEITLSDDMRYAMEVAAFISK